ncbi:putative pentatricopeptide repeat-containing protein [Nymphaea thermarum]|nr:putative pentatricopeptide repeat-containing protein [Nymphaea thermarum]
MRGKKGYWTLDWLVGCSLLNRSFKDLLLKGIEKYMPSIGLAAFSPSRECVHRGYTCRSFQVNHTKSNADDQMVNGSASPMNALNDQVRIASESRCSVLDSSKGLLSNTDSGPVTMIQDIMRAHENHTTRKESLDGLGLVLSEKLVLDVLQRHKSDWKAALFFFGWASNQERKLHTAVKLFEAMWAKGCKPDVAICNCIIDALCFKKKVPEALNIFSEMNERGCMADVATYNSLIKHLCKIRRMEKAFELLDEMEENGCTPNARTYNYFLKTLKSPEDVHGVLKRMSRTGTVLSADTYNLILKIFLQWNEMKKVQDTWVEMEKNGVGHDQRSYTVMVHGLYDKGKLAESYDYFTEMISKGMSNPIPVLRLRQLTAFRFIISSIHLA